MEQKPFQFSAGHVALDFANTLDNRFASEGPVELLLSYEDLVRFAEQGQLWDQTELERHRKPADAREALADAIRLREALYSLFSAVAQQHPPKQEDLVTLNRALTAALVNRRIARGGSHFIWTWDNAEPTPGFLLWPIALGAAELLVSADREFIRECRSDTCRWLFLDKSKNHSRRWCDMKSCGNRTKARRFHERHGGSSS